MPSALVSLPWVLPARPRIPSAALHIEPTAWGLGRRDASILAAMIVKLEGSEPDFEQAALALHEAVVEQIPAGRTYVLGATERGPILGSLITGVGIAAGVGGIAVVRVDRRGRARVLGSLGR